MIDKLSERFAPELHKQRTQASQTLTYVPTDKVIERLNAVFGTAWSWNIERADINTSERYAIVHGTLHYEANGERFSKCGVGIGQDMTRSQKEELDKILKTANSEAIKNAAKLLGVGLYLYDEGDRAEVEREMRQPKRPSKYAQRPADAATAATAAPAPPQDAKGTAQGYLFATVGDAARAIGITPKAATECAKAMLKARFNVESTNDCNPEQLREVADAIKANPRILISADLATA